MNVCMHSCLNVFILLLHVIVMNNTCVLVLIFINIKQVIVYTFQLLFNSTGFCVFCYTFLLAASHICSKQAHIQVGSPN